MFKLRTFKTSTVHVEVKWGGGGGGGQWEGQWEGGLKYTAHTIHVYGIIHVANGSPRIEIIIIVYLLRNFPKTLFLSASVEETAKLLCP